MTEPLVDAPDPHGLSALVAEFCEWLAIRNYSPRTIEHYRSCLGAFVAWAGERGIDRPGEVSLPVLERYQRALFHRRKPNGAPLTPRAQAGHLVAVRALFRWAARHRRIGFDPAAALELPRLRRQLPRGVLSVEEVEAVLAQPDVSSVEGVRDRAILETLYSTAMRGQEAAGLGIFDLDYSRGTVLIRAGKGGTERVVPISDRALGWVDRYLLEARPALAVPALDDGQVLFLTSKGTGFSTKRLGNVVRPYVDAAGITKPGACHLFRHTAATLMLEGGADLRYVQELLGHADITTTTIYTRVSIRALKAVHAATHPGATQRSPSVDRDGDDEIAAHLEAWLAEELATETQDLDQPDER
jgi:integrase/recombinase XerD